MHTLEKRKKSQINFKLPPREPRKRANGVQTEQGTY